MTEAISHNCLEHLTPTKQHLFCAVHTKYTHVNNAEKKKENTFALFTLNDITLCKAKITLKRGWGKKKIQVQALNGKL